MKITAKGTVAHISESGKVTSFRKIELKWKDLSAAKSKPAPKRRKAS